MATKNTKKEELSPDKSKNLASAINQIESQFGSGTIMRMGDKKVENIPSIFPEMDPLNVKART